MTKSKLLPFNIRPVPLAYGFGVSFQPSRLSLIRSQRNISLACSEPFKFEGTIDRGIPELLTSEWVRTSAQSALDSMTVNWVPDIGALASQRAITHCDRSSACTASRALSSRVKIGVN